MVHWHHFWQASGVFVFDLAFIETHTIVILDQWSKVTKGA
jgi:hypothetical protein